MPPSRPNFPVHSRMRVCWLTSVLSSPARRSSVWMFSPIRSGVALLTWMELWVLSRVEVAAARAWVRVTQKRVGHDALISDIIKLLTTILRILIPIQNLCIWRLFVCNWGLLDLEIYPGHMTCKCHGFFFLSILQHICRTSYLLIL